MPQTVRIHALPQDRRKVKQLQAHGEYDPGDGEARPGGPAALGVVVLVPRVPAPQEVLDEAAGDIGRHIVGIVPAPTLEIQDVARVHGQTEQRPGAQERAPARRGAVEPKVVHDGIVQPVEHIEPGAEVVELFGQRTVARVEDAAKEPARDADVGERQVERAQRVRGRDGGADLVQPVDVRPQVGRRKEDRERFLHAEEPRKGPFAVELDDGEGGCFAVGRDDLLARVVAFGGTVPEEETEVKGCGTRRGGGVWD